MRFTALEAAKIRLSYAESAWEEAQTKTDRLFLRGTMTQLRAAQAEWRSAQHEYCFAQTEVSRLEKSSGEHNCILTDLSAPASLEAP